jgi:uncharacterized protein (DUF58 family)
MDTSRSMGFDVHSGDYHANGRKLRYAKRMVAALAYIALSNLDRVSISALGSRVLDRMPTTRGKQRIHRVFHFLNDIDAESGTDLREALKQFVAQNKRRGLAVLLSDLYDPKGFEEGINVLRYNKFEPFVLHIVDPQEAHPPLNGDIRVLDVETGQAREITVTSAILDKYSKMHADYQRSIETFCTKKQVSYFKADVEIPFDEIILRIFRRGGFLR